VGSFDASNTRCDGEDFAAAISSGSSDEIAGEGFWNAAGQGFKDDIEDDDDDDDDDDDEDVYDEPTAQRLTDLDDENSDSEDVGFDMDEEDDVQVLDEDEVAEVALADDDAAYGSLSYDGESDADDSGDAFPYDAAARPARTGDRDEARGGGLCGGRSQDCVCSGASVCLHCRGDCPSPWQTSWGERAAGARGGGRLPGLLRPGLVARGMVRGWKQRRGAPAELARRLARWRYAWQRPRSKGDGECAGKAGAAAWPRWRVSAWGQRRRARDDPGADPRKRHVVAALLAVTSLFLLLFWRQLALHRWIAELVLSGGGLSGRGCRSAARANLSAGPWRYCGPDNGRDFSHVPFDVRPRPSPSPPPVPQRAGRRRPASESRTAASATAPETPGRASDHERGGGGCGRGGAGRRAGRDAARGDAHAGRRGTALSGARRGACRCWTRRARSTTSASSTRCAPY